MKFKGMEADKYKRTRRLIVVSPFPFHYHPHSYDICKSSGTLDPFCKFSYAFEKHHFCEGLMSTTHMKLCAYNHRAVRGSGKALIPAIRGQKVRRVEGGVKKSESKGL